MIIVKYFFHKKAWSFLLILFIVITLSGLSFQQYSKGQELETMNIKYGNDPKQTLDVYVPNSKNEQKYPVILYVHGGGWMKGDKTNVADKPAFFTRKGYALVSVNYRMFPDAGYKDMAHDVASAVKWVYDHADQFQFDKKRINLMGHSAGGHLVMLIGTNQVYLEQVGLTPNIIHTIVDLDGPIDMAEFLQRNVKYKEVFGEDRQFWMEASPAYYASQKNLPPMLIVSPKRPSIMRFVTKTGGKAVVFETNTLTHKGITKLLGSENAPAEAMNMTNTVVEFLHSYN